ncbi:sugar phosphate isomerase/epimerase family protein [Halobacillus halophilus]|uniref:sugar phosphate isomerase/epimerase family protein n=1 Tax=Halobacillus halophilus TaxID=1570 RepID=UPI001CD4E7BE|nr:sugar phosphate isomerase/epimerase [Halobacillus halophilus]MCA1010667.1 sugar phosphate isomerase/epimerase [Halobacillus halophilus]
MGKVSEVGYDGVEFAGYFDTPSLELKKTLDNLGLKAAGSHIGIHDLEKNLESTIQYSLEINSPYIICPGLPKQYRNNADSYKRTAELFNKIGETCGEHGLLFGYHNHHVEFEKHGGEYGLDILVDNTERNNLFIEFDTYWAEVCGLKSLDFMEKYEDRCKILHMKDMNDWDDQKNVEVGTGVMNFAAIVERGRAHGIDWYTVEQEEYEQDSLKSVEQSLEYLRGIV